MKENMSTRKDELYNRPIFVEIMITYSSLVSQVSNDHPFFGTIRPSIFATSKSSSTFKNSRKVRPPAQSLSNLIPAKMAERNESLNQQVQTILRVNTV